MQGWKGTPPRGGAAKPASALPNGSPAPANATARAEMRCARLKELRSPVAAQERSTRQSAVFTSGLPRLGSPVSGFPEPEPRARHTDGQKAHEWCALLLRGLATADVPRSSAHCAEALMQRA